MTAPITTPGPADTPQLQPITTLPGHYRTHDRAYDAVLNPATGTWVVSAYRVGRQGGRNALAHERGLPDLAACQAWVDAHRAVAVAVAGVLR